MTQVTETPVTHGADPPPQNVSLTAELAALKKAFTEFTEREKPEQARLARELADTAAERDRQRDELQKLKRDSAIGAAVRKSGFADPEYLDFLLKKHEINPEDADRTAEFLTAYRAQHPRAFTVPLTPGGGSRPGESMPTGNNGASEVEFLLENAPELF